MRKSEYLDRDVTGFLESAMQQICRKKQQSIIPIIRQNRPHMQCALTVANHMRYIGWNETMRYKQLHAYQHGKLFRLVEIHLMHRETGGV